MKAFFRLVVLGLILVVVALISALTAMRVAIHGGEVNVPDLSNMTPAEAEHACLNQGLLSIVDGQFYSTSIREGRVVSQSPAAGTRVRRGYRVHVAESLGPQRTNVPNVIGQSSRVAEMNLSERGLEVGTVAVAHLPGVAEDQVVAQSPPGNSTSAESPKISLLVGAAPEEQAFVMPSLVGRTADDANALINQAGLKAVTKVVPPMPPPPAVTQLIAPLPNPTPPTQTAVLPMVPTPLTVVHQLPAPGQRITPDMIIQLEIR